MGQVLVKTILRHVEEEEVILANQHSFTKGKYSLTNLVAFCGGVIALVGMFNG